MTEMEDGSDEGRLEAVMMVVSVRWQNGERWLVTVMVEDDRQLQWWRVSGASMEGWKKGWENSILLCKLFIFY
jgi:methanogenic corrinoid protein MtbC1